MKKVNVPLGSRSYQVVVGSGILPGVALEMKQLQMEGRVLVVTNTTVAPLYGESLLSALQEEGFSAKSIILPDGEQYKSLKTANRIYDAALEMGLDRAGTILALGGGVIGDMAGFAAATYMRGINFVQIPTTLLAQVDASVGGKVAVNHARGKNLIGSFYQPRLVWSDVKTLNSLPARELLSGWVEVIKYGIIWDRAFFDYLEENIRHLNNEDILVHAVEKSCAIKAGIVIADEREEGIRAFLNFGHTIGHALEAATQYRVFRHGEAVALGMVGATRLGCTLGLVSGDDSERIISLISALGLPQNFPRISWDDIWHHMQADKKVYQGNINFILPKSIGTVVIQPVEPELIKEAVQQCLAAD